MMTTVALINPGAPAPQPPPFHDEVMDMVSPPVLHSPKQYPDWLPRFIYYMHMNHRDSLAWYGPVGVPRPNVLERDQDGKFRPGRDCMVMYEWGRNRLTAEKQLFLALDPQFLEDMGRWIWDEGGPQGFYLDLEEYRPQITRRMRPLRRGAFRVIITRHGARRPIHELFYVVRLYCQGRIKDSDNRCEIKAYLRQCRRELPTTPWRPEDDSIPVF